MVFGAVSQGVPPGKPAQFFHFHRQGTAWREAPRLTNKPEHFEKMNNKVNTLERRVENQLT